MPDTQAEKTRYIITISTDEEPVAVSAQLDEEHTTVFIAARTFAEATELYENYITKK